jgi:hypothetical protein
MARSKTPLRPLREALRPGPAAVLCGSLAELGWQRTELDEKFLEAVNLALVLVVGVDEHEVAAGPCQDPAGGDGAEVFRHIAVARLMAIGHAFLFVQLFPLIEDVDKGRIAGGLKPHEEVARHPDADQGKTDLLAEDQVERAEGDGGADAPIDHVKQVTVAWVVVVRLVAGKAELFKEELMEGDQIGLGVLLWAAELFGVGGPLCEGVTVSLGVDTRVFGGAEVDQCFGEVQGPAVLGQELDKTLFGLGPEFLLQEVERVLAAHGIGITGRPFEHGVEGGVAFHQWRLQEAEGGLILVGEQLIDVFQILI